MDAVRWTGSGDGIIAGGVEVVLWKRSNRFWEIAWKFKTNRPQTLVSTTWSIEGPSATAAYANSPQTNGSPCVSVCQNDGKLRFGKIELNHPLPVTMVQWRPLGRESNEDGKTSEQNVLLTCCLDGTVRFWCEIDNVRGRKIGKDSNDHKSLRRSFCVAAVIEINQSMSGTLGMDVFVTWAVETAGIFEASEGDKKFFSSKSYDYDKAGSCEWIIGFGPGTSVSLWAVHCLDDVSPVRFPRVTLWKTLELPGLEDGLSRTSLPNFKEKVFLSKAAVLRNSVSGPPKMCSLIQLLPSNSLAWSLFRTQTSGTVEDSSLEQNKVENISFSTGRLLNLDGHTGKILQVAVHPYSCEVEFAVSLDCNGLLLFWSMSTISNCILGSPTLIPTWDLYGKLGTQDSCSKYTSLRWAPSMLDQELVLLLGHVGGIDCFVVKINKREDENMECHYLCTIPFTGHGPFEEGPSNIFSIPLPSTRKEIIKAHNFLLLGIWMNGFQALSWEVNLHSYDLAGSCCNCNFESTDADGYGTWSFGTTFCGKRYCVNVSPCSSQLPEPHNRDHVTSFALVSLDRLVSQISASFSDQTFSHPAYTMATGCANGYVKFWRSKLGETLISCTQWELVGMFMAHQGPISAICLSDCGRKVATICEEFDANGVCTVCIWESAYIVGSGAFILEDSISIDSRVVALNWLALGNGQLLLGVCMQNQLRVYAQRYFSSQTLVNSGNSLKGEIWHCIAFADTFSPIYDFLWGPRATAVVVHDSYLSVISQWLFLTDKNHQAEVHSENHKSNGLLSEGEKEKDIHSAIFSDCDIGKLTELSLEDNSKEQTCGTPENTNMKKDCRFSSLLAAKALLEHGRGMKIGLWNMLEVIKKLGGSLQLYHPDVLLMNVFTGIQIRTALKENLSFLNFYVGISYLILATIF